jgi:hypothetical protein
MQTITITTPTTGETIRIPVRDLPRCDERQSCTMAHVYLSAHGYAEGLPHPSAAELPAHHTCTSYRRGMCGGTGWQAACLFEEPAASQGWQHARRLADSYAELLTHERTWPTAKPTADLVAHSFGITADAAGAVLDDRPITTSADELSLGLAWALALVGCDESQATEIMAVWAPQADLGDPYAALELPAHRIYGALSQAAVYGVGLAETEAQLVERRL